MNNVVSNKEIFSMIEKIIKRKLSLSDKIVIKKEIKKKTDIELIAKKIVKRNEVHDLLFFD